VVLLAARLTVSMKLIAHSVIEQAWLDLCTLLVSKLCSVTLSNDHQPSLQIQLATAAQQACCINLMPPSQVLLELQTTVTVDALP